MKTHARSISVGLSYMYEPEFNRAVLPLLESGDVEALEWSFDTVADHQLLPDWQQSLLSVYADAGRLYGHGVYYSLLDARWDERQTQWLIRFAAIQNAFPFRHVSEHFGFMSSSHAHRGCPLPVPLMEETLLTGQQRLAALRQVAHSPVGVENLALAFNRQDVLRHGDFLLQLVAPVGGFIVLDLHNIYCQSHNFGLDMRSLILSYPLDRVREIHLSGGSWAPGGHGGNHEIRRDTHGDSIPEEVLAHLPFAILRCPNLDVVFVERLGDTLRQQSDEAAFREEFRRVKGLVRQTAVDHTVPPWPFGGVEALSQPAASQLALVRQQQDILKILSAAPSAEDAKCRLLQNEGLVAWQIGEWDLSMIDTAMQLGRKWGIESENT